MNWRETQSVNESPRCLNVGSKTPQCWRHRASSLTNGHETDFSFWERWHFSHKFWSTNVELSTLFLVASRNISAVIDFPDWRNNTAAMFLFIHAISHLTLPPSHLSLSRLLRSPDNVIGSISIISVCYDMYKSRGNNCSSAQQSHFLMTVVEHHPRDQWWNQPHAGNLGSLCGMRISLDGSMRYKQFHWQPSSPPSLPQLK